MDIENIRKKIRSKNSNSNVVGNNKYIKSLLYRVFFAFLIVLTVLLFCKFSNKYDAFIKKNVFEKKINLAYLNNIYSKYLGNIIPFKDLKIFKEETIPTFNSKLEYSNLSIYKEGIKLSTTKSYLVPSLESGLVLYVGEKEGYGKCAVVEQINNVDLWYCNLNITNIKLYDYVEKGKLIGEVDDSLYLVYQKDGKSVNYKDYFEKGKS